MIPAEWKAWIVLSVLAGEMSIAEAARREKVSEQSIGRWKADFLEAGKSALVTGRSGPSTREEQLEAQVEELTQALGEAAIYTVELALADYEELFGHPMVDDCPVDEQTGEVLPVVTIVTDNGGPFRSFRFEAFIELHPELAHVRTRVKSPGQNRSRERGFGTLKYERLFIDEIDDAVMLAERAEDYRIEYNQVRPHEAIA